MPDLRVLFVEDDKDIRQIAEFARENEGFEVLVCDCGEKALPKPKPIFMM